MNYLYGDSTPSSLKSNFLEFLRDSLDFSVLVLQSDERIKQGKERLRALEAASEVELTRLEQFIATVSRAIETADRGAADSPTARCAIRLGELLTETHAASVKAVRDKLASNVAKVEAAEAAAREACVDALAKLLGPHDPPAASTVTRVTLAESGSYAATHVGRSSFGLNWSFELAVPEGSLWTGPLRVERILPHLEIQAPQLSGWISKEVKTRPQKLERHVVTELVDDGAKVSVKLRSEIGQSTGFDLDFERENKRLSMSRVGPAGDASVGVFDVHADDRAALKDLIEKLRVSAGELERNELVVAKVEGAEFRAQPTFMQFVERLVAMLAPIAREIAERSLTPNEFVLRRALSDDRREEIFVSKATLREKYASLPEGLRSVFGPLGLETTTRARPAPAAALSDRPSARSELSPSRPPPSLDQPSVPPPLPARAQKSMPPRGSASAAPPAVAPPPPPSAPAVSPSPSSPPPAAASAKGSTPPPASTSTKASTPPASTSTKASTPPSASAASSAAASSAAASPSPPATAATSASAPSPSPVTPPPATPRAPTSSANLEIARAEGGSEVLIASLKKIVLLSKNGRVDEAYREYATLFTNPSFADYRPADQRQALKLMVLGKTPQPPGETVFDAHRAAVTRLKVLTDALREPSDYEMLGVACVLLKDIKSASEAFETALKLERARNPQSDLCNALEKRVSDLA